MTSSTLTTLRYRCHVACPSTGKTMARPTKNGKEPTTRAASTNSPQIATVKGLASAALIDVRIAVAAPTVRSARIGKETKLFVSTKTAHRKPVLLPATSSW